MAKQRKGVPTTPKGHARKLFQHHMATPGHTLEDLFVKVAEAIEEAEDRGFEAGLKHGLFDEG